MYLSLSYKTLVIGRYCFRWKYIWEFIHCVSVGTKGKGFQGDIAIDDVVILPGKCLPMGSCNFESNMCGYSNVQTLGDDVCIIVVLFISK